MCGLKQATPPADNRPPRCCTRTRNKRQRGGWSMATHYLHQDFIDSHNFPPVSLQVGTNKRAPRGLWRYWNPRARYPAIFLSPDTFFVIKNTVGVVATRAAVTVVRMRWWCELVWAAVVNYVSEAFVTEHIVKYGIYSNVTWCSPNTQTQILNTITYDNIWPATIKWVTTLRIF